MNIFKELRKKRQLTQEELANQLNLTQTAISKWEKDIAFPDIITLKKIAGYFNVSVDYLLGNETALATTNNVTVSPDVAKDIWLASLTPAQQSLIQVIVKLNELQQIKAQAYFAGLLGY